MAREKFEDTLRKLEELLRKMEGGEMGLEDSLKAFEEGIRLSRLCTERLDEAERRVEILLKEDEAVAIKPFAGAASED
jgi:exodeoxyribonuclease VII small subunit